MRRRGRLQAGRQGRRGLRSGRKAYVDLIDAGIFDPTKVVRGVSVASLLLLTEATMTEVPEEKKERASEADMGIVAGARPTGGARASPNLSRAERPV
jgi:hypothetical protein